MNSDVYSNVTTTDGGTVYYLTAAYTYKAAASMTESVDEYKNVDAGVYLLPITTTTKTPAKTTTEVTTEVTTETTAASSTKSTTETSTEQTTEIQTEPTTETTTQLLRGTVPERPRIVQQSPDDSSIYYVFDENGTPLGYVIVPEGSNIEEIDIFNNLIPFGLIIPRAVS